MLLCIPIIAAIPFTTAFVDDIKSGFIKHYVTRSSYLSYIIGKIAACALAGGLCLVIGIMIGSFTINLAAAPIESVTAPITDPDLIGSIDPIYRLINLIPFFLSGMLWALAGMLMSATTMNKHMAYASPFIFYYVLVILAERFFRSLYVLNPQNYLRFSGSWDLGAKSVFISLALFLIGIGLICYNVMQRRLR